MAWTVEAIDRLANWDEIEDVEDSAFRQFSWLIPALRRDAMAYADAVAEARSSMGCELVVIRGWGVA